jgi:hypothetical protein
MLSTRESNLLQPADEGTSGAPLVIAVAVRRSPDQLKEMQDALGPGFVVADIRRAPSDADLVLVPPCSPGTIKAILRDFPMAQILVVEGDGSPVDRALLAGASEYVRNTTAGNLADFVRWTLGRPA